MWDTAGQERFHSITRQYFRRAAGILIFFDGSDPMGSIQEAENWAELVREEADESATIIFIANKIGQGSVLADLLLCRK